MRFKKPKFWDYNRPTLLSYLLLPFTIILILNIFFSKFKKKNKEEKLKTICVGNIYVGGTGKTPTVIKLYELLKKFNLKISTAKKFYNYQKDENFILDIYSKFTTGKNRSEILKKILRNGDEIAIFDDGLQDTKLDYDIKIVCFDSQIWVGNGFLIPSGPLREKINSLKKYDAVFLKNIDKPNLQIINYLKENFPHLKLFNTNYKIKNFEIIDSKKNYLIFSGIGNPTNFKNFLKKYELNILEEVIFPDHHNYSKKDISIIKKKAEKHNAKILTTEKDFVKISNEYRDGIEFLKVDIEIVEEKELLNFLKLKNIYE